jgi:AraC-like DNA-binding protein
MVGLAARAKPRLGPGDGILLSNGEAWSLTLGAESRFTVLRVPASAIRPSIPDLGAAVARLIPAADVALQMLVSYVASSLDLEALVTPELTQLGVAHVYDLLLVSLGAARDAADAAKGRGSRPARLRSIKADILAHLGERNLSLSAVAARHGISPVYVRKLFESEGSSFSDFVLRERFARVHRVLSDPRSSARPIGAVAMEAGFGDLSYFNRAFRRRYGASPSDVRAAARGET